MNTRTIPRYAKPFFLLDLERVRSQYERLSRTFPGAAIRYAVKANNHKEVLKTLIELGSGFEVGSKHEAEMALALGAKPEDIIFSAPVKLPSHIRETREMGLELFVLDSREELDKLSLLAPRSKVMVRVAVSNKGSLFPLSIKFGTDEEEAVYLMEEAFKRGFETYGLAFHVGSQCTRKETWTEALETASAVWRELERRGVCLRCLDIGGGFPLPYSGEAPSIEEIADEVYGSVNRLFPEGPSLMLEPGRFLVGESAVLVTTVIGKTKREEEEWIFLDVGAFQGLLEAQQMKGNFPYRVRTSSEGAPQRRYKISGPTCDPDDTILYEAWIPEVNVGDRLYIMDTGAYSFVYASRFHGFSPPEIRILSKHEPQRKGIEEPVRDSFHFIAFSKFGRPVRVYDSPEFGEERRYELEEDERICKVYHNIGFVPDGWKEKLWITYEESLHLDEAVQEQSCYSREAFFSALDDRDYIATVLTVDGEPLGILLATNNLEKASIAYINPDFIRRQFPREVSEGSFWYVTTVYVSPKVRSMGFAKLMLSVCVREIKDKGWTVGMDFSDNNVFLIDFVAKIAAEQGWNLEKRVLGKQHYFALVNVPSGERKARSRAAGEEKSLVAE